MIYKLIAPQVHSNYITQILVNRGIPLEKIPIYLNLNEEVT